MSENNEPPTPPKACLTSSGGPAGESLRDGQAIHLTFLEVSSVLQYNPSIYQYHLTADSSGGLYSLRISWAESVYHLPEPFEFPGERLTEAPEDYPARACRSTRFVWKAMKISGGAAVKPLRPGVAAGNG
jgi:hypothetical protein